MSDARAKAIVDKTITAAGDQPDGLEAIARALMAHKGNVTEAAEALELDSAELRRSIQKSEALQAAMAEVMERAVDKAIGIIRQGMDEESYLVRFYAAKEFLRTETGRRRGFGMPQQAQVVEGGGGRAIIVLKWIGDEAPEPKTIDAIEGPLE